MRSTIDFSPRSSLAGKYAYFSYEEIRDIHSICADALTVMNCYVSEGKKPRPNLSDKKISLLLGFKLKKTQAIRLALITAGVFDQDKTTKNGQVSMHYYVGRSAVANYSSYGIPKSNVHTLNTKRII